MDEYFYCTNGTVYDIRIHEECYDAFRNLLISSNHNIKSELAIIGTHDCNGNKYYFSTYHIMDDSNNTSATIYAVDEYPTRVDCFNGFYKKYSTWLNS